MASTPSSNPWGPVPSPGVGEIRERVEEFLIVLERVRRGLGLDLRAVPERLLPQELDVILLTVELRAVVEEQREEPRGDLVLQPTPERPAPVGVHVDGIDVGDEDLER